MPTCQRRCFSGKFLLSTDLSAAASLLVIGFGLLLLTCSGKLEGSLAETASATLDITERDEKEMGRSLLPAPVEMQSRGALKETGCMFVQGSLPISG